MNAELLSQANKVLAKAKHLGATSANFGQYVDSNEITREMALLQLELRNQRLMYGAMDD